MHGYHPSVLELIRSAGYPALFLLLVAENLFPPIPSEAILPVAGFLTDRGELTFAGSLLAATAGSVLGALILYLIGRHGGRPLVLRYGRVLRVTSRDLDRAETWFMRWGDLVVLVARIVPIARSVVSVPAGTLRMGVVRFLVLTTIGSAIWNSALIGAGWWLGSEWERVSDGVGAASRVILVIVVIAAVVVAWRFWRRRIIRARAAAE